MTTEFSNLDVRLECARIAANIFPHLAYHAGFSDVVETVYAFVSKGYGS